MGKSAHKIKLFLGHDDCHYDSAHGLADIEIPLQHTVPRANLIKPSGSSQCRLIFFQKGTDADIVIEDDFLLHNTPLELVFGSPPTIHRDPIVPRISTATPAIFLITLTMLSIGAIKYVSLLCYGHNRRLYIACRAHFDKAMILHHEFATLSGVIRSMFSPGKVTIPSLCRNILNPDSVEVFSLAEPLLQSVNGEIHGLGQERLI
jgi:hypothetical protein